MKEEFEEEPEIQEEEAEKVDAGARAQRALRRDIRLTRRTDGTGRMERRIDVERL